MQRPREEGFEDKGRVSRTRAAGDQVTEDRGSPLSPVMRVLELEAVPSEDVLGDNSGNVV